MDDVTFTTPRTWTGPPPDDLDPRWEWYELRTLGAGIRYVKGPCRHLNVVPVESGGETVAHLCTDCDAQLP